MTNKEKQIEEMAQYIVNREKNYVCGETTCKICNLKKCDLHCSMYSDITYDCFSLYEAGYRKQSDTAKEILKPLYNVIMEHSECCVNLSEDIKFLMGEYGVNLEDEEGFKYNFK